jgi:hypothetical protein
LHAAAEGVVGKWVAVLEPSSLLFQRGRSEGAAITCLKVNDAFSAMLFDNKSVFGIGERSSMNIDASRLMKL